MEGGGVARHGKARGCTTSSHRTGRGRKVQNGDFTTAIVAPLFNCSVLVDSLRGEMLI